MESTQQGSGCRKECQIRTLALLEEDPTLAGVWMRSETSYDDNSFYTLESYSNAYPITYLIDFGCNINVIQKVYEMFPGAVREAQCVSLGTVACPVYVACEKRHLPQDTIIFLAKEYPEAVREHVLNLMGPCTLALFRALASNGRFASLEVIQTLVHANPEPDKNESKGNCSWKNLFDTDTWVPKF